MPFPDWTTLRIFLVALDAGSLTIAARRCGIAVSAATRRIQELEANHGIPLLERSTKGVRPTVAGSLFATRARSLLALGQRIDDDLRALATGEIGRVKLDVPASVIVGHPLPEYLAVFHERFPGIVVDLQELTSAAALANVSDGRSDLGIITTSRIVPSDTDVTSWRTDRLLAVVPAAWSARFSEPLPFAALLDHAFIGTVSGGAVAMLIEEQAERLGRHLPYRYRTASPDSAVRLVAAGLGLTVMPEGVLRAYSNGLALRGFALSDHWAAREIRIVSRPGPELSPSARHLLSVLIGPAV